MSVPLIDINIKYLVDFIIKTVVSNPDKYIKEIFGDAKLTPNAAFYGDRLFADIKQWILTTKIPCVLGFDLDATQIPGVSIHLERSAPSQAYMGDAGLTFQDPIPQNERDIIVPKFSPVEVVSSEDGTYITITLPDTMTACHRELVAPGLRIRDKNKREYAIGTDGSNPTAYAFGQDQLKDADLSEMEVISPYSDQTVREGVMLYDEVALVTVHGHADRSEGLWLWAIIQWGLLKYRPLLIETFSLDLATPSASDFVKDDTYLGENIWRRFITLQAKAVWSWEGVRSKDLVAFILSLSANEASDTTPPPENETKL